MWLCLLAFVSAVTLMVMPLPFDISWRQTIAKSCYRARVVFIYATADLWVQPTDQINCGLCLCKHYTVLLQVFASPDRPGHQVFLEHNLAYPSGLVQT